MIVKPGTKYQKLGSFLILSNFHCFLSLFTVVLMFNMALVWQKIVFFQDFLNNRVDALILELTLSLFTTYIKFQY